jgi:shikimate kinase
MKPADRVALVGFMGSGKSTVGRILAERLGFALVDTDSEIESRSGESIETIFRDRGEAAFRDLESEVLASLAGTSRIVIAAGGGAPARERNRDFFARSARTFYLWVSFETARERVKRGPIRPLLSRGEAAAKALYEERLPLYESAGTRVETEGRTAAEVADEIVTLLGNPTPNRTPGESE